MYIINNVGYVELWSAWKIESLRPQSIINYHNRWNLETPLPDEDHNHLSKILSYQRVVICGDQPIPLAYIAYKDMKMSESLLLTII